MKKEAINNILEVGTELVFKNGYNSIGLNKILSAAGIPKGSFYYYFKSKEDFGLKVIDFYANQTTDFIRSFLENQELDPKKRIFDLFHTVKAIYQEQDYLQGCLLGNSSLELAAQKDSFAQKIATKFDRWTSLFSKAIEEGQEKGSIKMEFTPDEYANFLINSWEGALVRMKSSKSNGPMDLLILFMEKLL